MVELTPADIDRIALKLLARQVVQEQLALPEVAKELDEDVEKFRAFRKMLSSRAFGFYRDEQTLVDPAPQPKPAIEQ